MNDDITISQADPTAGADKDFLENAVKALVAHPDEVVVERRVDELGVLLTLQVNQADMSKIIGKAGQTVKSLRMLLRVVGAKNDQRVNLKVLEADGSEYRSERSESRPDRSRRPAPTRSADQAATRPETGDAGASAESAFDS